MTDQNPAELDEALAAARNSLEEDTAHLDPLRILSQELNSRLAVDGAASPLDRFTLLFVQHELNQSLADVREDILLRRLAEERLRNAVLASEQERAYRAELAILNAPRAHRTEAPANDSLSGRRPPLRQSSVPGSAPVSHDPEQDTTVTAAASGPTGDPRGHR